MERTKKNYRIQKNQFNNQYRGGNEVYGVNEMDTSINIDTYY